MVSGRPASAEAPELAAAALRAADLWVTRPRLLVLDALAGGETARTVGEVRARLTLRGESLSPASTYRVLHDLAAAGVVHVFDGGEQRFRRCDRSPHGHLVCTTCHRVVEVPLGVASSWIEPMRDAYGFVVDLGRHEIFGRCRRCAPPPS